MDSTDAAAGPPKFVTKFNSSYDVQEMQGCHLEARLTPAEDPNMKVSYKKHAFFSNVIDLSNV